MDLILFALLSRFSVRSALPKKYPLRPKLLKTLSRLFIKRIP